VEMMLDILLTNRDAVVDWLGRYAVQDARTEDCTCDSNETSLRELLAAQTSYARSSDPLTAPGLLLRSRFFTFHVLRFNMQELIIHPSGPLHGRAVVPGDKSITHGPSCSGALADGDTPSCRLGVR